MKSDLKEAGEAVLTIDGKEIGLSVFKPAHGPDVIDIRKLYKESGAFTFDPGYTSTAS